MLPKKLAAHTAISMKDTVILSQSSGFWLCTASAAPPGSPAPAPFDSSAPPCPATSDPHSPQSGRYLGTKDREDDAKGGK